MVLLPGCQCCGGCRVLRPGELPDSFELDVDFPVGQSWNYLNDYGFGGVDASGVYRNYYEEITAQSVAVSGSYSLSRLPASSSLFGWTPDALWSYSSSNLLLYAAYYTRYVGNLQTIYSLSVYAAQTYSVNNTQWTGQSSYPVSSQVFHYAGPKVTHYEKVENDVLTLECGYAVSLYDVERPVVSYSTNLGGQRQLNFGTTAIGIFGGPLGVGAVCREPGTETASLASCALPLSWSAKLGVCWRPYASNTITTNIPKGVNDIYSRTVTGSVTGVRAVTAGQSVDLFNTIGLAQCFPYSK